jgi:hypothetical protein
MSENQKNGAIQDARAVVEHCLRAMLSPETPLPPADADWIGTGLLDSMGHSEVLICIENTAGVPKLFDGLPGGPPRSTRETVALLKRAISRKKPEETGKGREELRDSKPVVCIAGWGHSLGAERIPAAAVEKEHALPADTILRRAGIESVARAAHDENELDLAARAAVAALVAGELPGRDNGDVCWSPITGLRAAPAAAVAGGLWNSRCRRGVRGAGECFVRRFFRVAVV